MENQEHKRASYAYRCIKDIENLSFPNHEKHEKKYRSLVESLPTRLQTIGLMQTLAFNCAKMKNGDNIYFVKLNLHIMKWLLGESESTTWNENAAAVYTTFTTKLLPQLGTEKLMIHSRQAIDLAIWLKRFAEASLKKAEEGEDADH